MKAKQLKEIIGKIPDEHEVMFMAGCEAHEGIAYIAKGRKVEDTEGCVELPEDNWLIFLT